MSEANKAIYCRAWQELMNQRNLTIVDELFAPNYVRHDPHFPLRGREALKGFVTAMHTGFSALRFTIDDLIVEGNTIVKRFTLTCTHTGAFSGMPASGKRLTLTGLTLSRMAHGQILEEWESTDWLGWQQQLGIIPETTTDAPMALALPWPHLTRSNMMTDLQVTTTRGTSTTLDEATVQAFAGTLRGAVLRPGDTRYDSARAVWNGMIDKHPALIVRCAGVADVIHAVNFARTHDVLVSVRGGGHNIAGNSVCAGGLMIDLAAMQGIHVEPGRRTARAQAGVTLGALDLETQAFGLATTLGTASETGIAGLTLGGGYGWLAGKYGMACDNLLGADMVTARGELVRASETENPELFWGLRGGGGNFGVVTSFEYRLHEVGPVLGGPIFYPFTQAKEILQFYNEFAATAPDELSTVGGFLTAPDGHLSVAIAVCYCGDLSTGDKVVQPLRHIATPTLDCIQPMPYLALQRSFDELFASGRHYYWKSSLLRTLSDSAIDGIVECASAIPTALSVIVMQQLHGAATRVSPTATAFAHRYNHWNFIPHAGWTDGDSARHIAWVRETWCATQPFLEQTAYVNDLGDDDGDRVQAAYGQNYSRLVALKNQYDPTNFFRLNQNIKPTV